jgi:D-lactate dehydrogenase (cytochrome)
MMEAIKHAGQSNKSFEAKDSLFFKFQGSPSSIKETSKVVQQIVQKYGSSRFESANNQKEADELWHHRKIALWSTMEWVEDPNVKIWTTDVCVPPSQLPRLVAETKKDIDENEIISCVLGHVGDGKRHLSTQNKAYIDYVGNFHALLAFRNDGELEKVRAAVHRLVHRALELDGTCTGEHGVGIGKKEYLTEELGEGTVILMRAIKQTVDPMNLFNPGKVTLYPLLHIILLMVP